MKIRIQKNYSAGNTFKVLSDAFVGSVDDSVDGGKQDNKKVDKEGNVTYEGNISRGLYIGERDFDLVNHDEWGININNETKEPLREIAQKILGIGTDVIKSKGQDVNDTAAKSESGVLGTTGNIISSVAKIWYSLSGRRFDTRALGKKLYTGSEEKLDFNFELYITPYGEDMQTITQNYTRDLYFLHSLTLFGKDEETKVKLNKDDYSKFQDYLNGVESVAIAAADYENKNKPECAEGDDGDGSPGSSSISSVQYIFLHCTDSKFGDRAMVEVWHKKRDFNSIGYNYLIPNGFGNDDVKLSSYVNAENGKVVDGRYYKETKKTLYPSDTNPTHYAIGAQVKNYNSKSLGISCTGTFKDNFSIEQLEALRGKVTDLIPIINKSRMSTISTKQYNDNKEQYDTLVISLTPYLRKLNGTIIKPSYKDLYNSNTYLLVFNSSALSALQIIRDSNPKIKLPIMIAGHTVANSGKTCPKFDVDIFMKYVSDPSVINKVACIKDRWGLILPQIDGLNVTETILGNSCRKKADLLIEEINSKVDKDEHKITIRDLALPVPGYSQNAKTGVVGSASKNESSLKDALNSKMYKDSKGLFKKFGDVITSTISSTGLLMYSPPYVNLEVYNTGKKVENLNTLSGEIDYDEEDSEDMLFQLRNMLVSNITFEYSNIYYKYQSTAGEGMKKYGSDMKTKQIDKFLIPTYIKVNLNIESSIKNPFEVYIDQFRMYDVLKSQSSYISDDAKASAKFVNEISNKSGGGGNVTEGTATSTTIVGS